MKLRLYLHRRGHRRWRSFMYTQYVYMYLHIYNTCPSYAEYFVNHRRRFRHQTSQTEHPRTEYNARRIAPRLGIKRNLKNVCLSTQLQNTGVVLDHQLFRKLFFSHCLSNDQHEFNDNDDDEIESLADRLQENLFRFKNANKFSTSRTPLRAANDSVL